MIMNLPGEHLSCKRHRKQIKTEKKIAGMKLLKSRRDCELGEGNKRCWP